MKTATISELKYELKQRSQKELVEFCLRTAKFKKENKELLTYLLFDSYDEYGYIKSVKKEIEQLFKDINKTHYYYIKKSIRKILFIAKKYIRYSQKKQSKTEIMIFFLYKLKEFKPTIKHNSVLRKLYEREYNSLVKTVSELHEDLQFDYADHLKYLMSL